MRKVLITILIIALLTVPVSAMEFTAPTVPGSAEEYMPADTESFSEGLWHIFKIAVGKLQPSIAEASGVCLSLIAVAILISVLNSFSNAPPRVIELVGTLFASILFVKSTNALIQLGVNTTQELSEYSKLLFPVMTAAMAAQGGVSASAALYAGTAALNAVLSTAVSKLLVPLIYIFLCLCIANSAIGEEMLKNLANFVKWLMTWFLKIVLYVFTGYMGITGVVSGSTDAAAMKATKLALTGFVPVVGGIISDASESILVGAGVIKSAVGVYGLLAMLSIFIMPFLQIGIQYLMIKITASICGVFGVKKFTELLHNFSTAMGFLLAITGTVCLMLLISTVCFMKGVS